MSDFDPLPTPDQRRFLQRLRSDKWRRLSDVRTTTGDRLLTRVMANGWIERRGEGEDREVRLTASGLEALRAKY